MNGYPDGMRLSDLDDAMGANDDDAITCPHCQWVGFAEDATEHPDGSLSCPDCDHAL